MSAGQRSKSLGEKMEQKKKRKSAAAATWLISGESFIDASDVGGFLPFEI